MRQPSKTKAQLRKEEAERKAAREDPRQIDLIDWLAQNPKSVQDVGTSK